MSVQTTIEFMIQWYNLYWNMNVLNVQKVCLQVYKLKKSILVLPNYIC